MTISSTATTAAVTASSVMLAPENESAMSAPNAGPPVTSARRSPGNPSAASARTFLISSVSAKPDRSLLSGTTASAAAPSSETCTPGHLARAASRSTASNGAPSPRVSTTIAGAWSPPGNSARSASTRADSAVSGTGTGDCALESSLPISPIRAPETSTTSTASTHDKRRDMGPII